MTAGPRRLVVGMSGSSAPQLGIALLRAARDLDADIETHLVISAGAERSLTLEAGCDRREVEKLADVVYDTGNTGAAIASGSFLTLGMVVIPCSMRTLAAVATGNTTDLLTRAADVCLKERRRLVLVARETPLNLIHLRNMVSATEAGAIILPPVPAFYHRPRSLDDLLDHTVGKVFDLLGVPHQLFERWH